MKYIGYLVIATLFFSCIPQKKMEYTQEDDSMRTSYKVTVKRTKLIEPNDRLYIKIISIDEQTTQLFDAQSHSTNEAERQMNGFVVSEQGYIDFPFVGKLHVAGLSIEDARKTVEKELSQYLPNSAIKLNFLGSKVTVLGEVKRPGNFLFYEENLTIFQAIAMAGGADIYADKSQALLLREKNNELTYHKIDLTRRDVASNEFYYLLPNDVLILEPLKTKYKSIITNRTATLVSVLSTTVTVSVILLDRFAKDSDSNSGQ